MSNTYIQLVCPPWLDTDIFELCCCTGCTSRTSDSRTQWSAYCRSCCSFNSDCTNSFVKPRNTTVTSSTHVYVTSEKEVLHSTVKWNIIFFSIGPSLIVLLVIISGRYLQSDSDPSTSPNFADTWWTNFYLSTNSSSASRKHGYTTAHTTTP